jgi:hypothetical protein
MSARPIPIARSVPAASIASFAIATPDMPAIVMSAA